MESLKLNLLPYVSFDMLVIFVFSILIVISSPFYQAQKTYLIRDTVFV